MDQKKILILKLKKVKFKINSVEIEKINHKNNSLLIQNDMLQSTLDNQKKQMFNSSNQFNKQFQSNYNYEEKQNFDIGDQGKHSYNNIENFNNSIIKEKKQNQQSYQIENEKNIDFEKPKMNSNLHYSNVKIDKVNESKFFLMLDNMNLQKYEDERKQHERLKNIVNDDEFEV